MGRRCTFRVPGRSTIFSASAARRNPASPPAMLTIPAAFGSLSFPVAWEKL